MTDGRKRTVERGDFQTPPDLALEVMQHLAGSGPAPRVIVEPTCGRGAFLGAAAAVFPRARLLGFELDEAHVRAARDALPHAAIERGNVFDTDWPALLAGLGQPLLIVGNPPWVTSATLGALGSANVPRKSNASGARGIAARTGQSNFDVSEWIVLRLLEAAASRPCRIGMLVKLSVARKILAHVDRCGLPVAGSFRRIDARRHFGVSVEAGLLVLEPPGRRAARGAVWPVYEGLAAARPERLMASVGGVLTHDLEAFERTHALEGQGSVTWRSGIKHDCAAVFEIESEAAAAVDPRGKRRALEPAFVYPLLKGSDVANRRLTPRRSIIVPQRSLARGAVDLAREAPATHRYLSSHKERLGARKSSVHRGPCPYSIFGVGEYSFAPFKVATCGLYKRFAFELVRPFGERPVMLDDTCYFLPFWSEREARAAKRALDSAAAQDFYGARVFWDAKRPITKSLLSALCLDRLIEAPSAG